MATHGISRVSIFRIPRVEDQEVVLEEFKKLKQCALKDGKPYILSVKAGRSLEDARNQDYSVVLQTTFDSLEDMQFFDNECQFHVRVKKLVAPRISPPPVVVFFKDVVSDSTA
ncbi:hypothetical protein OIDMADRAFT_62404 [Oidiodendron maius Zn]|uniref:Stress-response A/B barrel domain-containing protein n=1 Tax=Oidiodendron maius (strain Zn) TaxID=913774 RepID=A0A0C3C1D0_OIDMZ|nr:hypothetical protein OIDMADRAFT_62404 [Oidiodendron maius Zn]